MKKQRNPLLETLAVSLLACLAVVTVCSCGDDNEAFSPQNHTYDLAITNGRVIDPFTGTDQVATVAIANGKIAAVSSEPGKGSAIAGQAARVIDARGLVVSPGFINTHTHEGDIQESMKVYVKDGITTWIGGNCGFSPSCSAGSKCGECPGYPIRNFFQTVEHEGLYNNFASLTGLNSLRCLVGLDYKTGASAEQINQMVDMLASDLADGSLGISFGAYYHPGCTYAEMRATAVESAAHGGMAASHIRDNLYASGGKNVMNEQMIDEAIQTAREAGLPYIVSHITDVTYGLPATQLLIDKVSNAIYDEGLHMGADVIGSNSFPNDFFTIVRYGTVPVEMLMGLAGVKPSDFQVTEDVYVNGELVLKAYDSPKSVEQVRALIDAIRAGQAKSFGVLAHIIRPANTMLALAQPFVFVGNDGYINKDPVTGKVSGHPRAAGSMARFLGHWTRDMQVMGLMQALYKVTAAPARWFGLESKGRLAQGYDADLVVFNPDTIIDTAVCEPGHSDPNTFLNPPAGISYVIVNGQVAVENGELTGAKKGKVIRRTWAIPGTAPEESANL